MRKKAEIFFRDHFALKDVGFLVEIVHINFDQVLGVLPISEKNRLILCIKQMPSDIMLFCGM